MADYDYEIGVSAGARQNVEDVITVPPQGQFNLVPVRNTRGDGLVVGDGLPVVVWLFDYLTQADMTTMLGYLGSAESAFVSIKTRQQDGTYQAYAQAIMHRPAIPDDAVRVFNGYENVTFRFTHLEV